MDAEHQVPRAAIAADQECLQQKPGVGGGLREWKIRVEVRRTTGRGDVIWNVPDTRRQGGPSSIPRENWGMLPQEPVVTRPESPGS